MSQFNLLVTQEEVDTAIERIARGLNERYEGEKVLVCPLLEGL